jgi:hypothetical protein
VRQLLFIKDRTVNRLNGRLDLHKPLPQFLGLAFLVGFCKTSCDFAPEAVKAAIPDAVNRLPGAVLEHVLDALRNCPNNIQNTNSSICSDPIHA